MAHPEPLPDIAAVDDEGHVDDHNLITAAVRSIDNRLDAVETSPPGGVSDHGALTGNADDDHPQYLTQARGDARYELSGVSTGGYGYPPDWAPGESYPQGAVVRKDGMLWRLTAASEPNNGYGTAAYVVEQFQQDITAGGTFSRPVSAWADARVGDVVVLLVAGLGGPNVFTWTGGTTANLTFLDSAASIDGGNGIWFEAGALWRRITNPTPVMTATANVTAARATWFLVRGCAATPTIGILKGTTTSAQISNNNQTLIRTSPDSGFLGGFPAQGLALQAGGVGRAAGSYSTSLRLTSVPVGGVTWQSVLRESGLASPGNNGTCGTARRAVIGFAQQQQTTVYQTALRFESDVFPVVEADDGTVSAGVTVFVQAGTNLAPTFDTTAWTRLDTTVAGSGDVLDLYPLYPQSQDVVLVPNRRQRIDLTDVRHGDWTRAVTLGVKSPTDLNLEGQWMELRVTTTGARRKFIQSVRGTTPTNVANSSAHVFGRHEVVYPAGWDGSSSTINYRWDTTRRMWVFDGGSGDALVRRYEPYQPAYTSQVLPITLSPEAIAAGRAQTLVEELIINAYPDSVVANVARSGFHMEINKGASESCYVWPDIAQGVTGNVGGNVISTSTQYAAGTANQGIITAHEFAHAVDSTHHFAYSDPVNVTAGGVVGDIRDRVVFHPRWVSLWNSVKSDPSIRAYAGGRYSDTPVGIQVDGSMEFFAELLGVQYQQAAFPSMNNYTSIMAGLTSDEHPLVIDEMLAFLDDLGLLP
jgi:hypothetical protein